MTHKQEENLATMRDILGEDFVRLSALSYHVQEDFETGVAEITCQIKVSSKEATLLHVKGEGRGFIDAFFAGVKESLAHDYPSLNSISFGDFSVRGIMATRDNENGSDAEAEVSLTVRSSEGKEFDFVATSRSVTRASIDAVLQAAGYFVNSEKCFIAIYNYLKHYRAERRSDLVTKYQLLLTQMVQNTSYTSVIEQIKSTELNE